MMSSFSPRSGEMQSLDDRIKNRSLSYSLKIKVAIQGNIFE